LAGFEDLKRRIAAGDRFHFLSLAFFLAKRGGVANNVIIQKSWLMDTRGGTLCNGKCLAKTARVPLEISIELVVNIGTQIFWFVQLYPAENQKKLLKCDHLFVVFVVFVLKLALQCMLHIRTKLHFQSCKQFQRG